MRKSVYAVLSFVLFSIPALARDRHQSYISYDDGQATVRQRDGREVEARVNVPIFSGDELETGRRGLTEVRLADGNIVALDRSSALRFQSILDSYESEDEQTVAELLYGTAMVHAIHGDTWIRVDTPSATYVSRARSLYSIESASGESDDVSVFSGSVEIRTPEGSERIRAGERVRVDRRGIYGQTTTAAYGNSDFERWYIRRAERYGRTSRYLDRRVAYADSDLDGYGSWLYVNDYDSWVWRPYVSAGWRPYYYGRWGHSPFGSLMWISHEPWGWVPYHYGRWAFSSVYGWVWLPGAAYSHAWVYWAFGPSYIGWIPAGWYDCYRPYYPWAYRPFINAGFNVGFGFRGRVRFANIDYRAWTFVDPDTLVSHRADRAALTTDAIRNRLTRDGDAASVSNIFPKLGRDQLKDPGSAIRAIARRGAGSGTGKDGSGSLTDLTPFFRRDPELPSAIRDRIARPLDSVGRTTDSPPAATSGTDRLRRGGVDSVESGPRSGGGVITRRLPDTPGNSAESSGTISRRPRVEDPQRDQDSNRGGIVRRERNARPAPEPSEQRERQDIDRGRVVPRERVDRPAPEPSENTWRGRVTRREIPAASDQDEPAVAPAPAWRERPDDSGRISRPERGTDEADTQSYAPSRRERSGDDIPRQIIDRIGGARLEPSDRSSRSRASGSGSIPRIERPQSRPESVSRPSGRSSQPSAPAPSSGSRPERSRIKNNE